MTDSNHDNQIEERLTTGAPLVPGADPPSIDRLNQRVATVRRRRQSVRFVSAAAATLLFVFVTRSSWQQQTRPTEVQENLIAEAGNADAASDVNPEADPITHSKTPTSRPPKIQLYASVSQSVPVFDFDEQTQAIHHVGWVEAQQEVPVDMKYVPDNQQNSFKAVLSDDDAWNFSL